MMSCGNPLCQCADIDSSKQCHCRCGVHFCNEKCFIQAWNMGHSRTCRHTKEINDLVQQQQLHQGALQKGQSAMQQIVKVALGLDNDRVSGFEEFDHLSELGKGAFARVKKVACRRTGKIFAMKTVDKDVIAKRGMDSQLRTEISVHQRLEHANIIRMHAHFEEQGSVHLLLEHAAEGQLFELLQRQGCLSQTRAARIFADVSSALMHLHTRGIAHRDVKAENVLLCSGQVAKLADFGWCAELPNGQTSCTFCGTIDYLAPEVVVREAHDTRMDVWAAGVLLFVMLVGELPFAAQTLTEKFERIRKVELRIPEHLSPAAHEVISGMLKRSPEDRMLLAEAMRHELVEASGCGTCIRHNSDCSTDAGESESESESESEFESQIDADNQQHQSQLSPEKSKKPKNPLAQHSFALNLKALDAKAENLTGTEQSLASARGAVPLPPFTARGKLQTDPFANLRSWIDAQKAQEAPTTNSCQHKAQPQLALVQLAQELEMRLGKKLGGSMTSRGKLENPGLNSSGCKTHR